MRCSLNTRSNGGGITQLAWDSLISRTVVYMLAFMVDQASESLFDREHVPVRRCPAEDRLPYVYLLSLRLEGRCRLNAISTLMARFELPWSPMGKISET